MKCEGLEGKKFAAYRSPEEKEAVLTLMPDSQRAPKLPTAMFKPAGITYLLLLEYETTRRIILFSLSFCHFFGGGVVALLHPSVCFNTEVQYLDPLSEGTVRSNIVILQRFGVPPQKLRTFLSR